MVEFRRWITALAVLALFAGLASAQVGGPGTQGGPLTCTATVAVPPALRSEGMTELIGDIVVTCSGGSPTTAGQAIPTANFTVSLGTNVTSRILGTSSTTTGVSEALLLIDEPGVTTLPAPVPGFGPQAPQILCSTPSVGAGPGGCVEYAQNVALNGGNIQVASASSSSTTNAPNVFQGLVNANQVTFQGIPVLAPVTSGSVRVFRITNVRANVSGLGGGGLPGTTQLLASVSISGSTSVPINQPVQIAGFIQSGLTVTYRNANNSGGLSSSGAGYNQCGPGGGNSSSSVPGPVAVIQYSENFGTAFKTRVAPTAAYTGQAGQGAIQNIPGTIYNSESGFISSLPGLSNGTAIAGLADYGTRLKAIFNNIPAGVRIFVSVTNLAANETSPSTAAPVGNTNTSSFAILINGEASPDANGYPPALSPSVSVVCTSSSACSTTNPTTGLYDITNGGAVAGQSYVAVWEVINTNPATDETFNFGVWTQYSPNPTANTPPPGTATVSASYAPTPAIAFSATAGATASSLLTIPRFVDPGTYDNRNVLALTICQTLLLFPFVTNTSGFDTGIAISNTTSDPVGTAAQAGTCTLSWYGSPTTPNTAVPSVATGTVYTTLASVSAPGFTGYMFALCNFQMAHGFAFISDIGARNLAMGYLALVVNNGSNPNPRNTTIPAENLSH